MYGDGPGGLASCMYLRKLSLSVCIGSLVCRYVQQVTLVKKWVSYMPRKGVKLKIGVLKNSSCSGSSHVSH